MKKILCLLLVMMLTVSACVFALAETTAIVNTKNDPLNMWRSAGSNDSVVQIPKGETVVVLEKGDEWTKIEYDGKNGYVKTEYLEFPDQNMKALWEVAGDIAEKLGGVTKALDSSKMGKYAVLEIGLDYDGVFFVFIKDGDNADIIYNICGTMLIWEDVPFGDAFVTMTIAMLSFENFIPAIEALDVSFAIHVAGSFLDAPYNMKNATYTMTTDNYRTMLEKFESLFQTSEKTKLYMESAKQE